MLPRALSCLLCLLFGIALALPQVAMSDWKHGNEGCLMEVYSVLGHASPSDMDQVQAQSAEKVACPAPCPACFGISLALLSVAPHSLEPRWSIDEMPSQAPPDRLERPPRV